jgi:hypothetical protein
VLADVPERTFEPVKPAINSVAELIFRRFFQLKWECIPLG